MRRLVSWIIAKTSRPFLRTRLIDLDSERKFYYLTKLSMNYRKDLFYKEG